uniref:Uncharacterized protein n=1 Tax=Trypanosoma congolense (strain IL3000) TaxID=1068625 RepID=G0UR26_TRYCI|nr:hypothetical protein, unlikely [Trypanosoma congolense IL3000]
MSYTSAHRLCSTRLCTPLDSRCFQHPDLYLFIYSFVFVFFFVVVVNGCCSGRKRQRRSPEVSSAVLFLWTCGKGLKQNKTKNSSTPKPDRTHLLTTFLINLLPL